MSQTTTELIIQFAFIIRNNIEVESNNEQTVLAFVSLGLIINSLVGDFKTFGSPAYLASRKTIEQTPSLVLLMMILYNDFADEEDKQTMIIQHYLFILRFVTSESSFLNKFASIFLPHLLKILEIGVSTSANPFNWLARLSTTGLVLETILHAKEVLNNCMNDKALYKQLLDLLQTLHMQPSNRLQRSLLSIAMDVVNANAATHEQLLSTLFDNNDERKYNNTILLDFLHLKGIDRLLRLKDLLKGSTEQNRRAVFCSYLNHLVYGFERQVLRSVVTLKRELKNEKLVTEEQKPTEKDDTKTPAEAFAEIEDASSNIEMSISPSSSSSPTIEITISVAGIAFTTSTGTIEIAWCSISIVFVREDIITIKVNTLYCVSPLLYHELDACKPVTYFLSFPCGDNIRFYIRTILKYKPWSIPMNLSKVQPENDFVMEDDDDIRNPDYDYNQDDPYTVKETLEESMSKSGRLTLIPQAKIMTPSIRNSIHSNYLAEQARLIMGDFCDENLCRESLFKRRRNIKLLRAYKISQNDERQKGEGRKKGSRRRREVYSNDRVVYNKHSLSKKLNKVRKDLKISDKLGITS
jgi:hypothetical protein